MEKKTLLINGIRRTVIADQDTTLLTVLREHLLFTEVKNGCDEGHCGACSVILNGKLNLACLIKMGKVPDESTVMTVDGIGKPGSLHPIQQAFIYHGAAQCGICSPGFVVSAKALSIKTPNRPANKFRDWFTQHHNVCRCNGYIPYVDGVMDAAAVSAR